MEAEDVLVISNTIPTEVKVEVSRSKSEPIKIKVIECKCEWCKEDKEALTDY